MMKKTTLYLLIAGLGLIALIGCTGGESAPAGTAVEIADKIFAESQVEHFGMTQAIESSDDKAYFLGSNDYPEFAEAFAVMPMINLDTRVMIIIKAGDKGDVATIKTMLEENIDPDRVVCVSFSLQDVTIESRGDVVLLLINTDTDQRTALAEAFLAVQ